MPTFDWNEPLPSPDGSQFFWSETNLWAFDEDLSVTVYYEVESGQKMLAGDARLDRLSAIVEATHEYLKGVLRDAPALLGLSREQANAALERREPGAMADATEITLYRDGDSLVRFPYADLPGNEAYGVGITVDRFGKFELQDLRESVEVGDHANA